MITLKVLQSGPFCWVKASFCGKGDITYQPDDVRIKCIWFNLLPTSITCREKREMGVLVGKEVSKGVRHTESLSNGRPPRDSTVGS